ncbi:MAG TPA: hypothetical protein VGE22_03665 [Solimonas sp.]
MSGPALSAGDLLSYSAGSTQTGPDGFRKVNRGGLSLTAIVRAHWPHLLAPFGGRTPLVINAYPATIGFPTDGAMVDCYLSPRTASRALQLAAREDMPVILMCQSLFLAELLFRHVAQGFALPNAVMAIAGGYCTPHSLHASLTQLLAAHGVPFTLLQGYGVAEVEAGMLWGVDYDAQGRVIYRPRGPDIHAQTIDGRLHLALKDASGKLLNEPFDTGDDATISGGDILISNARSRLTPAVMQELESWDLNAWRRRTGYLGRHDGSLLFQLREGEQPADGRELGHYLFGDRFGFSWLNKPRWGL